MIPPYHISKATFHTISPVISEGCIVMKFSTKIIFLLQLLMFYLFPLFAGPTDGIGMVVLIMAATLILSMLIGITSDTKIKLLYPVLTAILFIPSVSLYYNETALIHAAWYFIISILGVLIGALIAKLCHMIRI